MLSLPCHSLSLCTHRQGILDLVLVAFFVSRLFALSLGLLHHLDQTESTSRVSIFIQCLIYQGLFIEVDAVCLLSEEVLAILPVADPDHHQLLDSPREVLPVVLVVYLERINHFVLSQVEQCVPINLVLIECALVWFEHGIRFDPARYVFNCPISDILVLQNEGCDFAEGVKLLERCPGSVGATLYTGLVQLLEGVPSDNICGVLRIELIGSVATLFVEKQ